MAGEGSNYFTGRQIKPGRLFHHEILGCFVVVGNHSVQDSFTDRVLQFANSGPGGRPNFSMIISPGDRWLPIADPVFFLDLPKPFPHQLEIFEIAFDLLFVFRSDIRFARVISASMSSPASKSRRRMAESVIFSFVRLIGRR